MRSRLGSLIRKEFIQIIRDPRTLALTFVYPIMMLLLLGYAATNDVRNIPLAVYDQDRSAASRELLDSYRAADYFTLAYEAGSTDEIKQLIDSGAARAAIIIPPDYSEKLLGDTPAQIGFIIDGSDPTLASTALTAATLIGQSKGAQIIQQRISLTGRSGSSSVIEIRTQVWYNPEMVSAYFMIPGLIGMILQFLTTILTATSIVREKERGTIEQLIVTPLKPWELVVGKITPYIIIAFMDTIEILVAGMLLFHVPINGSVSLLLILCALFLVTTLGIGLLVSTAANTQQEAMLITMFTLMPSIFLSGFFFPLAAMPDILQWISHLVPLRYFLVITRGIVLKGVGMEAIYPEVIALSIFAVVVMSAAALRFKKRLE
ncbi:MAG: ABC transporter permease [Anaerolinea sp.]|nr:ABC transporter permease [Anaerolinea sp.]